MLFRERESFSGEAGKRFTQEVYSLGAIALKIGDVLTLLKAVSSV